MLLARVVRARVERTGEPLIYHDGGYASVSPAPADRPAQLRRLSR
jgi:hypothetical protein